jgi:hypothetical protein
MTSTPARELAMTVPEAGGRGLDPAHIIAVCWQPSGAGDHCQHTQTRRFAGGYRVTVASRRGAGAAAAALTRVGYEVTHSPGQRPGRDLLVTGWSAAGLESRLAAMRAVVHRLTRSPSVTAQAVIETFRTRLPAQPAPSEVLEHAGTRLRTWAYARTGPCVPHDPAIVPGDVRNALRLRLARQLEQAVDDLIAANLRAARYALALYIPLSQVMDDTDAQHTAINQAATTLSLPGNAAQDSSALLQDLPPASRRAASVSRPPGRPPPPPGQLAARDFPAAPATSLPSPTSGPPAARPGGRRFPAARPGPRH